MSTKAKVVCSSLVLSLIIMLPVTTRAEAALLGYQKANQLFEQIQDIELMQRNIEACYHAETGVPIVKSVSRLSSTNPEGLDGALINRVFGYLAGTPEYHRFIKAYGALIQLPDYRRLHTDELLAEYKRLLESGRIRFSTQLKERQETLAEKSSSPAHEGLTQAIPGKSVTIGRSGPAPLTEDQIRVSRIVVHGMDQSGLAGAGAPTIDMVELHIFVAQERVADPEKVSIGYHHGLVKGVRSGTRTNPKFSDGVETGVAAWDQ
jgi:hypothetical protein